MNFLEHDEQILMLCEDLQRVINGFKVENKWLENGVSPFAKRLQQMSERITSEQRIIEEIGLPGRFIIEHFTTILGEDNYSLSFKYRDIHSGRGCLNRISVGPWATINLKIGDVEVSWRDKDVQYMFYPDQVVIRPKDSVEDEITLSFSYSFRYSLTQLQLFQKVKDDPQTIYWHESLMI